MDAFEEVKDHNPSLQCACGHPASDHLYCGGHSCVRLGCDCQRFILEASLENVLTLVRGPSDGPSQE